ncbi:MAG TPA: DUF1127 domain-containing protein [Mesorhizobium sp.]|uniref:DUF1127 domain-containing protein n=1 Tax=Mesorhizobium sp. TaxID=1871066 RepID=UPI002DDD1D56|nr:DUF1127 domain-containing protein [Mesorhizobium sp.]HEV2502022.1 DUF1127 domain-containing protein [Mesorhizobium sp.]
MNDSLCASPSPTRQSGSSAKPASYPRYSLLTLFDNITAWRERTRFRWELRRLARDNPHLIDDLGLTREQVEDEIGKLPFWQR